MSKTFWGQFGLATQIERGIDLHFPRRQGEAEFGYRVTLLLSKLGCCVKL